jgi:hypothetical protein
MIWPKRFAGKAWRRLARSGMILPSLLLPGNTLSAGAWWYIDNCATIPKGAVTPPYGTHLSNINAGQYYRAQADRFVIYKHEWYLGGTDPGPAGRRHLTAIGDTLACVPFPIVVQPVEPEELEDRSPEAAFKLNEERRRRVVEYLAARGEVNADRRVILGYPTAEGLYGVPADLLGRRYIFGQGGFGGAGFGGGGFGGAGFGGGGFGGAGFGGGGFGVGGGYGGMGFGGGMGGFF